VKVESFSATKRTKEAPEILDERERAKYHARVQRAALLFGSFFRKGRPHAGMRPGSSGSDDSEVYGMLRNRFALASLSAVALLSFLAACGSDDTSPGGTGGNAATGGVEDAEGARPPAAPEGAGPADGTDTVVLAMNKLFLGDTDRNGTASTTAWKKYGYNLDGKVSTKAAKDLCKPPKGGTPSSTYPDGDDGIDNAFGKTLMPIIGGLANDPTGSVQEAIDKGSFTIMLAFEKLGAGKDYNPLLTKLYGGATLDPAPKWDGTDEWPLVPELLNNASDPGSAKVQFPTSYVADNTWVSGSEGTVKLSISVQGYALSLNINKAIISAKLAADHKSASDGIIAGVLDTEQLIAELKKIAGNFDAGMCDGTVFDGIANQLRGASDIMKDGSQDPSQTCDGISIGLGFDATEVKLGPIAPAAEPGEDPCAAGGG
jgi:hypothetical protein